MSKIKEKVDLYVISLGLLFVFFIIMTLDVSLGDYSIRSYSFWLDIFSRNIMSIISVFGLFYCIYAYINFKFKLDGVHDIPFKIKEIESINYEHLTFLATYVVPLISFDFDNGKQLVVLFTLLFVMGVIYIKTDLFYANPSLALLGYHIYRADGEFKFGEVNSIILISRSSLNKADMVSYIKLDDRIYYVKRK